MHIVNLKGGYLSSYEADQVLYSGTVWCVRVGEDTKYEAMLRGRARCRVYGLFHGYGWLRERPAVPSA